MEIYLRLKEVEDSRDLGGWADNQENKSCVFLIKRDWWLPWNSTTYLRGGVECDI
jgi:hypothetical protein